METAISVVKLMPSCKAEQETFALQVIDSISSGHINPLELDILLKSIEDTIELIRKNETVKRLTIEEAEKYPEKEFNKYNASIQVVTRKYYDYKGCGDCLWEQYDVAEKTAKNNKKDREIYLQIINEQNKGIDEQTGEILNPPAITYKKYLKIIIK